MAKTEIVKMGFGPDNAKTEIKLRWEPGSNFVFATYGDNRNWAEQASQIWRTAAAEALQRFCALKNLSITGGPRPEDSNPFNMMVEIRERAP